MGFGRQQESAAAERRGLTLNAAFDQRDTLFTKAAEHLADIMANPPTGPRAFDLLNGSVRELSSLLVRQLPLRTTREARLAQAVYLSQIVEETTALALGQGVAAFLSDLQAAADDLELGASATDRVHVDDDVLRLAQALRALPSGAAHDGERRSLLTVMADTPTQTLDGALAKLQTFRAGTSGGELATETEPLARLLADAVGTVERVVLSAAVAKFDAGGDVFEAAMPQALPSNPTDKMLAAGAKAGSVAMDAVRRIYQAMASEFLSPSKGVEK